MANIPLLFVASVAALAGSLGIVHNPRVKIAVSETLAVKLERAAQVDPRTEQTVADLVATMRASGPQTDPAWEYRRQASIERLEILLADWRPAVRAHTSP